MLTPNLLIFRTDQEITFLEYCYHIPSSRDCLSPEPEPKVFPGQQSGVRAKYNWLVSELLLLPARTSRHVCSNLQFIEILILWSWLTHEYVATCPTIRSLFWAILVQNEVCLTFVSCQFLYFLQQMITKVIFRFYDWPNCQ